MDEYVKKEEVVLALLDKGQRSTRYKLGESWELNLFEIREAIDNMKSADVEPVRHGRWVHDMVGYVKCSLCNDLEENGCAIFYNFCPNCGAKMDGGEKDD